MQNRELILRVRSPEGQMRVQVKARDTYGQLLLLLSKKLNYLIKDIIVAKEDGKPFMASEGQKLGDIPYFQDGAILKVDTKNPKKQTSHIGTSITEINNRELSSKCNHPPGGKCLNCMEPLKKKEDEEQESKPKCNHGPGGKCLNCIPVNPKTDIPKAKCQHGPNAKCIHCLDAEYISDAAHVSFDAWLEQKRLACKGVHPQTVKCHNCLPPSKLQYEVDKNCKYHEPYPKAMCNKCIPPSVVVKRQEYRHVDYVQFMNINQIQDFVKYWVQKKHTAEQRVGYLYGYYSEDPHYKGGIRVIVEAIYQPDQKGSYGSFQIIEKPEQTNQVEMLANGLTLERVGWIYTETNHDCIMTQKQARMAARLQQEFRVQHESGYDISTFVTVVLRTDQKNPNDVKPEVYMISDQGQALQRSNLFVESSSRKLMKIKVKENNNEAYPTFICAGKNVTEFQPQFLLVKISHGSSKNNNFAILKRAQFPAFVRDKPSKKDLKQYLKKSKHQKQCWLKYGDFNLLLYLAAEIDLQTVLTIADAVAHEGKLNEFIEELIEHKADL